VFLRELLEHCPTAGDGVHHWIFKTALHLWAHFDEPTICQLLRASSQNCGRPIGRLEAEIADQVKNAYRHRWQPRDPLAFARAARVPVDHVRSPFTPKLPPPHRWPEADTLAIQSIVASDIHLADLCEHSPVKFDDDSSHAEEIIDVLFPGNPLLCVGKNTYDFDTCRRETWRGHLSQLPLMVPNPMLDTIGLTGAGRLSKHSKANTADWVYLVVEFDFAEFGRDGKTLSRWAPLVRQWRALDKTVADGCAALHLHLAERLPLVCVVHSGGKSLHGWYYAFGTSDRQLRHFMDYAVTIGADHHTWLRSQFVRIPDGLRENGRRQRAFYFDPGKAVKL
jgi:hypothetical protein